MKNAESITEPPPDRRDVSLTLYSTSDFSKEPVSRPVLSVSEASEVHQGKRKYDKKYQFNGNQRKNI